ncbi:MAG: hypothetical protein V2A73_15235 [Pseudomonadota bacterium]
MGWPTPAQRHTQSVSGALHSFTPEWARIQFEQLRGYEQQRLLAFLGDLARLQTLPH